MKNCSKNVVAKIMGVAARKSAEAAADSRCVYLFHQPKQPKGIKAKK